MNTTMKTAKEARKAAREAYIRAAQAARDSEREVMLTMLDCLRMSRGTEFTAEQIRDYCVIHGQAASVEEIHGNLRAWAEHKSRHNYNARMAEEYRRHGKVTIHHHHKDFAFTCPELPGKVIQKRVEWTTYSIQ